MLLGVVVGIRGVRWLQLGTCIGMGTGRTGKVHFGLWYGIVRTAGSLSELVTILILTELPPHVHIDLPELFRGKVVSLCRAVDLRSDILDRVIDLPGWLTLFDGPAFDVVEVGDVIDAQVSQCGKRSWFK